MKSKIKKISIIIIICLFLISLFILYKNVKQTNIINSSISEPKSLVQELIPYRKMSEETIDENNSQYSSTENGNIIIMEYSGDKECVIVPNELNGHKIENIDAKSFINKENLEEIKIPIDIAKNIEELEEFQIDKNLSDDEYIVYVTTKEYTEEYINYIKSTPNQELKNTVIPRKFVSTVKNISNNSPITYSNSLKASKTVIPSSFDLRNSINISVENQGSLETCYAYATIKSIETNLSLNKNIKKDFSEMHLAVKSKQFAGGNFYYSYVDYLTHGYGPVIEVPDTPLNREYLVAHRNENTNMSNIYNVCTDYNFNMTDEQIESAINFLDESKSSEEYYAMSQQDFAYINGNTKQDSSYADTVENNRNLLKESIMKNGSAATFIKTPKTGTNYYDAGSIAVQCQLNSSSDNNNHLVSIIGWDDNFDKSNFPSAWGVSKNGAWLVLNSWGGTWGNGDGTWWISYEDYYVETYNNIIREVSEGKVNLGQTDITLSNTSYNYDGISKTPVVSLCYNGVIYNKGKDYTVEYSNNINAGTGIATVTGIGRFTGTINKEFKILPRTISSATISTNSYTYDGTEKKQNVTVKYNDTNLIENQDYVVEYTNNINAGTATVTVTGIGNYTGTFTKTFTISPKSIKSSSIELETLSYTYDGTEKKPRATIMDGNIVLTENQDYTITYKNNINKGTATVIVTGIGNYTGTVNENFTILPKNINLSSIELEALSYTYDGTEKKPRVTIMDGNIVLTENQDYTITYSNNINAGIATVTIIGTGNYTNTKTENFQINKADIVVNVSETNVIYNRFSSWY